MVEASSSKRISQNTDQAVLQLQKELRRRAGRRWLRLVSTLFLLGGLVGAVFFWRSAQKPPPEPRYGTQALAVRDIVERVESTGRLKPLTEVQIGAQVSGRVVRVWVDFNSKVKEGDLLAEIDPLLFGAQVGQVQGQLRAAEAQQERAKAAEQAAKTQLDRTSRLNSEGVATDSELDQARSNFELASAEVRSAAAAISGLRAQLKSARTTLDYTKIYSPIDGVVINRTVEPGQTVAASLSAPVLFVIAQDLRQMQVLAEIDEADVGKLLEGMSASVQVDAFVGETFAGEVTQIHFSPNEVQGVVTYSAVIDVANRELKLRPGMTATVAITTRKAEQVIAAPNAALRFKPEGKDVPGESALEHGKARLYQVSGGAVGAEELTSVVVKTGITDGLWTALQESPLSAGAEVVTEQRDKEERRRKFLGIL